MEIMNDEVWQIIKKLFIFFLILLIIIPFPNIVFSEKNTERGPLSPEDIEILLKAYVSHKRIVKLINKHGVNFVATEDNLHKLRKLGGDNNVIQAIRQASAEYEEKIKEIKEKAKKKGWISVMSYPKGIVFINGEEIGYTPLVKREIPVGQHEILVRVNGNEQKRVVIVRENETVEVSFQFDKAY